MNCFEHWKTVPQAYLLGKPETTAVYRHSPEDFTVVEDLGFALSGEGEHHCVQIEKMGENTDWVAQVLSRYCGVKLNDVGYAGKKDRHARTTQWFSIWLPGRDCLDLSALNSQSIRILTQHRHSRKLKKGVLKGNRFSLVIREISNPEDFEKRLWQLVKQGVPNYFGEQRFGRSLLNVAKAESLLSGRIKERNANKRGLYISALRSALFNTLLSARLTHNRWDSIVNGEVLMLNESQSCFVYDKHDPAVDLSSVSKRLDSGELHVTLPLWGAGQLMTQGEAAQFEKEQAQEWLQWCDALSAIGLKQERRSVRFMLQSVSIDWLTENVCRLEFVLPAGCYATSVLRELFVPEQAVGEEQA